MVFAMGTLRMILQRALPNCVPESFICNEIKKKEPY